MNTHTGIFFAAAAILACTAGWAAPNHPRVMITKEDIPRLRARVAETEENALGVIPAQMWQEIKAQADTFVAAAPYTYNVNIPKEGAEPLPWSYTLSDEAPPLHEGYNYPPWTAMFQERGDSITTRLRYFVTAYIVSGENIYFEKAKEIVLQLCAWDIIWTDPSYGGGSPCLDTGHAAQWVAIFYDWCYDAMDVDEREIVREALIEKAIVPIDEYIDKLSPYHNFTGVLATGLCFGGLALLDEEERAEGWVAHAVDRAKLNFDAQGKDGGSMEGPGYGTYASNMFADIFWGMGTAGIENPLADHNFIKTLPRHCVSMLDPNSKQQPCFGDGGPTAGHGRMLMSIALQGDPDAAWYLQQIGWFAGATPRNLLAIDPAKIRVEAPDYNPSRAFVDIGYGILRDGYEAGPAFMGVKCGPPTSDIGHNHFDSNSFMLNYMGTWIGWDPGYRNYFEPRDRRYTTSTFGHSTIVLDVDEEYLANQSVAQFGHDQVRLSGGQFREFYAGTGFDYTLGDAATTYNNAETTVLEKFDRQIIFAKPDIFFIRDTLVAPEEHAFSAMFHLPNGASYELAEDGAEGVASQVALQIQSYSPDAIEMTAGIYEGAEKRGPWIAATTGWTDATTITSVLIPRRFGGILTNGGFESGMGGWLPRSQTLDHHSIDTEVKHSGNASARIDEDGYYYTERFKLEPGTEVTVRWWAKTTGTGSAMIHHWQHSASKWQPKGPTMTGNQWKQYEMTTVVPEGADQTSLALNFSGGGTIWFDDVEIIADNLPAEMPPATVTPIDEGQGGCMIERDGDTHIMICGEAGKNQILKVGDYIIETDAEIAAVKVREGAAPEGFMVRGTVLRVNADDVTMDEGTWQLQK